MSELVANVRPVSECPHCRGPVTNARQVADARFPGGKAHELPCGHRIALAADHFEYVTPADPRAGGT